MSARRRVKPYCKPWVALHPARVVRVTLAASYLAKARGSGEPEVSSIRCRDLDGFIRDIEAFMLDKGYIVGPEYDARIERYRRRFEEIIGVGSGGVGDQVPRAQMQMQQMQQMAKTASPV